MMRSVNRIKVDLQGGDLPEVSLVKTAVHVNNGSSFIRFWTHPMSLFISLWQHKHYPPSLLPSFPMIACQIVLLLLFPHLGLFLLKRWIFISRDTHINHYTESHRTDSMHHTALAKHALHYTCVTTPTERRKRRCIQQCRSYKWINGAAHHPTTPPRCLFSSI